MPPQSSFGRCGIAPLKRDENIPVVSHNCLCLAFGWQVQVA